MNYSRFSTTGKEQQTLLFYQGEKKRRGNSPLKKKVTPLLFLHRHEKPLDFSTPSRVSICNKKGLSKNIAKTDISKVYKHKETDNIFLQDITILF